MLDNSYWQIPQHTFEGLQRYFEERIPTGDFLYAVLTNNLFLAIGRADDKNLQKIKEICGFIYNELPSGTWGNKEKVENWLRKE